MSVSSLMPGPLGPDTLDLYLTAFADGELDAVSNLAVLHYIADHPEALAQLEQAQRIRLAAQRAVNQPVVAPPSLREQIEAMAIADDDGPLPLNGGRFALMRIATWVAAAVLLLAFGMIAGRATTLRTLAITRTSAGGSTNIVSPSSTAAVPATLIADVTRIHVDCSRFLAYHTGGYPMALTPLSEMVKADLSSDRPEPDLTSIGYTFVGAGPCGHPLDNTVHLLYRSSDKKPGAARDTLSVFVQPYTGQYQIEPAKAYLLTPADAPHPLLMWRSQRAVYFITGDDMDEVQAAATAMPAKL